MEWIKLIIICISCYVIAAFIHELGHVLTGIYNGWKLSILVVGPIGFKGKPDGGIKLYFEKNVKFWGGVGGTLPQNEDVKNINIWANILLAGPLASIVTGLVLLPVGIYFNNMFSLIFSAMSIGMGIASVLPYPIKNGILFIDGYRWKRLKKKGTPAGYLEEVALFKLSEFENLNKDFLSFNTEHIQSLKQSNESVIKFHGYYAEYKYFLRVGDNEKLRIIEENMDKLKAVIPKFIFDSFKSELIKVTTAVN